MYSCNRRVRFERVCSKSGTATVTQCAKLTGCGGYYVLFPLCTFHYSTTVRTSRWQQVSQLVDFSLHPPVSVAQPASAITLKVGAFITFVVRAARRPV